MKMSYMILPIHFISISNSFRDVRQQNMHANFWRKKNYLIFLRTLPSNVLPLFS